MSRVVLDTNVLVIALISKRSPSAALLDRAVRQGVILYSTSLVEELTSVLMRPRIRKYVSPSDAIEFLAFVMEVGEEVVPTSTVAECRDPGDNHILALALDGGAHAIVTGDDDLLVLHPFRGIPILTPRAFLERDES